MEGSLLVYTKMRDKMRNETIHETTRRDTKLLLCSCHFVLFRGSFRPRFLLPFGIRTRKCGPLP
jgi:hypothetical protein